jgi:hypothetical protein
MTAITAPLHTHNRTKEWHACCHEIIMGRDPKRQRLDCRSNDVYEHDANKLVGGIQVDALFAAPGYMAIDLRCSSRHSTKSASSDSWMEAAHAMSSSISEVAHMIRTQSASYTSSSDTLNICFQHNHAPQQDDNHQSTMSNTDRSILETTVASFAASMAKQIDSLRQTVTSVEGDHPFLIHDTTNSNSSNNNSEDQQHPWASGPIGHRAGIASCLMTRLKLEVMEPMTRLTVVRQGKFKNVEGAVRIVQNPLLGFDSVVNSGNNYHDDEKRVPPAPWEIGEHDLKKEEMERLQEAEEFTNVYHHGQDGMSNVDLGTILDGMKSNLMPPSSIMNLIDFPKPKSTNRQPIFTSSINQQQRQESFKSPNKPPIQTLPVNEYLTNNYQEEEDYTTQQLQRESAALLSTYQQSDLESVHKVERSMVEITQLVSKFTDLITEQQEDILMIHDQAVRSKENVDKGQDQLVDAARRGEKSSHPIATFIVFMALLLLFFNWIFP